MTMATITTTAQTAPASATASGGFTRTLGDLANGLAAFWVRREAIKALRAMNDRELRDIGITRSHIDDVVWGRTNP
jgi:uncharacterized protein YjiS (DUF1127 family)